MAETKPKILVSSCLMGAPVRYNGGAVRVDWVTDELKPRARIVQQCPEVAMGLTVPREAMRLVRTASGPVLQTSKSAQDMTALAQSTVGRLIAELPDDLDAAVLTAKSPLCGAERVKIYDRNAVPENTGIGFFAAALAALRPDVIVVDSGRMMDERARAHFFLRVETQAAIRAIAPKAAALQDFHRRHKFLWLACGRVHLKSLGKIVADARAPDIAEVLIVYRRAVAAALKRPLTRPRLADSLMHMYGFLKDRLPDGQKTALLARIEEFRSGGIPLAIPLALLRFCNAEGSDEYLASQVLMADSWRLEVSDQKTLR